MTKINRVSVSQEEVARFKLIKKQNPQVKSKIIYSFFPVDPGTCPCQKVTMDLIHKFEGMTPKQMGDVKFKMEYLRCPRDKSNMQKFKIHCGNCQALVGECFATDITLEDFCDFHYICSFSIDEKEIEEEIKEEIQDADGSYNGKFKTKKVKRKIEEAYWQGALGVNMSPIDQKIGIECACGNDTRDFRANSNLPDPIKKIKIVETMQGRKFGKEDSKYLVVPTN